MQRLFIGGRFDVFRHFIIIAAWHGAACCVNVVGTPYGPRWDGGYRDNFSRELWEMAVKMIRQVIDTARPQHTKFCIESMPWMIPSSPDEYLRLWRGYSGYQSLCPVGHCRGSLHADDHRAPDHRRGVCGECAVCKGQIVQSVIKNNKHL